MTTAAVVLAAGSGSRFVGPTHKLRAPFRGDTVVGWAVRNAHEARLTATFVVVGAVADLELPDGVTAVENGRWQDGMATSLRAGIVAAATAGHDAVVVGLGDQPLVAPEAWCLVAAADATSISVATYGGHRRNPVRLASLVWAELPAVGERGARDVMRQHPDWVTEVPCPGSAADIDTVEDLSGLSDYPR